MSIVLPCGDIKLRSDVTQRPARRTLTFERLDPTTEREVATMLAMEIDFQLRVEQLKQDIERLPGFSLRHIFKAIDSLNYKFIDEQALRRFLKMVGHQPLKCELIAIMRRFDLDGDAKLNFDEFAEALTPV